MRVDAIWRLRAGDHHRVLRRVQHGCDRCAFSEVSAFVWRIFVCDFWQFKQTPHKCTSRLAVNVAKFDVRVGQPRSLCVGTSRRNLCNTELMRFLHLLGIASTESNVTQSAASTDAPTTLNFTSPSLETLTTESTREAKTTQRLQTPSRENQAKRQSSPQAEMCDAVWEPVLVRAGIQVRGRFARVRAQPPQPPTHTPNTHTHPRTNQSPQSSDSASPAVAGWSEQDNLNLTTTRPPDITVNTDNLTTASPDSENNPETSK